VSSRIFALPENLEWKNAYLLAVLEKDRARIPGLIQMAKEKLCKRLRELLAVGSAPSDEVEAIHDALDLLQALQSSLSYRDEVASEADRQD